MYKQILFGTNDKMLMFRNGIALSTDSWIMNNMIVKLIINIRQFFEKIIEFIPNL